MPRARFLTTAAGVTFTGAFLALALTSTAVAQPGEEVLSFVDVVQTFVVPDNVCEIGVEAFGGQGGDGDVDSQVFGDGALGAGASAVLQVTPGETLEVFVGGAGEDAPNAGFGDGGFPDGGRGGSGGGNAGGGGGGGSSSVRRTGAVLVIAGGGGGGGGGGQANGQGDGGAGGGTGQNGANVPNGAQGGQSGGNGGAGGSGVGAGGPGGNGAALEGGGGGDSPDNNQGGGGGGGGAVGGGGGGASSANNTNGGGGGGGGSSDGPVGASFATGVRAGDGQLTLTFEPDPVECPSPTSPGPPAPTPSEPPVVDAAGGVPEGRAAVILVAVPRFTG